MPEQQSLKRDTADTDKRKRILLFVLGIVIIGIASVILFSIISKPAKKESNEKLDLDNLARSDHSENTEDIDSQVSEDKSGEEETVALKKQRKKTDSETATEDNIPRINNSQVSEDTIPGLIDVKAVLRENEDAEEQSDNDDEIVNDIITDSDNEAATEVDETKLNEEYAHDTVPDLVLTTQPKEGDGVSQPVSKSDNRASVASQNLEDNEPSIVEFQDPVPISTNSTQPTHDHTNEVEDSTQSPTITQNADPPQSATDNPENLTFDISKLDATEFPLEVTSPETRVREENTKSFTNNTPRINPFAEFSNPDSSSSFSSPQTHSEVKDLNETSKQSSIVSPSDFKQTNTSPFVSSIDESIASLTSHATTEDQAMPTNSSLTASNMSTEIKTENKPGKDNKSDHGIEHPSENGDGNEAAIRTSIDPSSPSSADEIKFENDTIRREEAGDDLNSANKSQVTSDERSKQNDGATNNPGIAKRIWNNVIRILGMGNE